MATVVISFEFVDKERQTISVPLHFDAGDIETLEKAQDVATTYITKLHGVSANRVQRDTVTFPLTSPAVDFGVAMPEGYSVRAGATLSFRDSQNVGQSLYVPGVYDTQLIDGVVNSETTQMATLLDDAIGRDSSENGEPLSARSGAKFSSYVQGRATTRKIR